MESIIDLLFQNPIIIGAVIYFAWRMFKPSKEEAKNPPKRNVVPPSTDTRTSRPALSRDVAPGRSVERRALTTTAEELENPRKKVTLTQSNSLDTVSFDFEQEKKKLDERKKKAEEALKSVKHLNQSERVASVNKHEVKSHIVQRPTSSKLREGILWAEILGKPRSKRSIR